MYLCVGDLGARLRLCYEAGITEARMYCDECARSISGARNPRDGGAGADRFGRLQCQRCGTLLSSYGSLPALRAKLRQLARFGLADARSSVSGGEEVE